MSCFFSELRDQRYASVMGLYACDHVAHYKRIRIIIASIMLVVWVTMITPTCHAKDTAVPTSQSSIDMNQADAVQLASVLDGVGVKKAEAIVAWRQKYGPFHSVEAVAKVKGMAKLAEKNRAYMSFGTTTASSSGKSQRRLLIDEHILIIPMKP